jgi:hypothetical protein
MNSSKVTQNKDMINQLNNIFKIKVGQTDKKIVKKAAPNLKKQILTIAVASTVGLGAIAGLIKLNNPDSNYQQSDPAPGLKLPEGEVKGSQTQSSQQTPMGPMQHTKLSMLITPSVTATGTITPTPTPLHIATPTPTPSTTPRPEPSNTPMPTDIPEPIETPVPTGTPTPTPTATPPPPEELQIMLTGSPTNEGIQLEWTMEGEMGEFDGFKVMRCELSEPNCPDDYLDHILDTSARSYPWVITDGQTYNIRVCQYMNGGCGIYSNNVEITAPSPTP